MLTIHQLNNTNHIEFIEILGGIFEHSPWIAEKAEKSKPFSSLYHLYQVMVYIVDNATLDQKLELLKEHPNLGERAKMSEDSVEEQKGAGLKDLTREEYNKLVNLNNLYMEKFDFPFILAVRGKNKYHIYEAMESRIHNDKDSEFHTALNEIYKIARLRLEEKIIDIEENYTM